MYFCCQDLGADHPALGFLRLHCTQLNDLKIYSFDKGRVKIIAAAFIKCLYALGGEIASILVQMMNSANINDFLDNNVESTKDKRKVKKVLHNRVDKDRLFTPEDSDIVREREEIFRFI